MRLQTHSKRRSCVFGSRRWLKPISRLIPARHRVSYFPVCALCSVSLGDLKRRFPRDILASLQNTASHRVTRDAARREQELKKASKFATIVAEGEKFAVRQGKAGKHAQTIPPPRRHSEDTVSQRRALTSKHDVVMGRDLWMLKVRTGCNIKLQ